MSTFERYLTLWVALCIAVGVALGHGLPGLFQAIGSAVHPTRVIGISLNTYDLDDAAARAACGAAARETGLPATDPVRFDPGPLVDAVMDGRERHRRVRSRRAG